MHHIVDILYPVQSCLYQPQMNPPWTSSSDLLWLVRLEAVGFRVPAARPVAKSGGKSLALMRNLVQSRETEGKHVRVFQHCSLLRGLSIAML